MIRSRDDERTQRSHDQLRRHQDVIERYQGHSAGRWPGCVHVIFMLAQIRAQAEPHQSVNPTHRAHIADHNGGTLTALTIEANRSSWSLRSLNSLYPPGEVA